MKFLRSMLAAPMLLAASVASAGMTVETYLKIQKIADGTGGASEIAKSGQMQFLVGLTDTFRLISGINGNTIPINGVPAICLPSDDVLTVEIISSSIRRVIGTPNSPTPTGVDWKDILVSQAAFAGLTQTFPCAKK